MKTAEKLTDEANKKICSGEILQNLKPAAGKEFSDLPWEESEDMKEICVRKRSALTSVSLKGSETCTGSAAPDFRKKMRILSDCLIRSRSWYVNILTADYLQPFSRGTAGPFFGPGGAAFHTRVYII